MTEENGHGFDASFEDHYETLQLSPSADSETIEKVYRILAKRFHPDNPETGDVERFNLVHSAYRVLSDPEERVAYDVRHSEQRRLQWQIFDQSSASDSFESDRQIFRGVLSVLYTTRRQNVDKAGLGSFHLEELLGCPAEHLEFHMWFLKEKGWVTRLDNGQFAITVEGIEKLSEGDFVLRKDRLLSDGVSESDYKSGRSTGTYGRFLKS